MKIFFDTSVLVAAFVGEHPRHERSFNRLRRARSGEYRMLTSTHILAELYAVLTTLPVSPRIPPATATRMIRENLGGHADILPLTVADYREVLRRLGEAGLAGGVIYDALACRAAVKAGADLILTLNPRDFNRLRSPDGPRIEEP